MDDRLAVEAEGAALRAFGGQPVVGLEPVIDAVEGGDAGGAGGEHDPLQRVDEAGAPVARPAGRGRRRDRWCRRSGPREAGAIAAASSTARGVSIIASTGLPISQPASCTCLALSALARTMKSAALCRTATTSSP